MRVFDNTGKPLYRDYIPGEQLPPGYSVEPFFPGYTYDHGKSLYWGEEVGEGGYVYAEPGMYGHVALLDIASMHPSSIIAEELFGPVYTRRFADIKQARIEIKHENWDAARKMLDGKLEKYIQQVIDGKMTSKQLANALKTAINSVYGLTSASFENPFHDPRNKDNIVAKRGALFMVNLKHAVQDKGFKVAHIKTDSIKIPDATPEIIQFVMDYGKEYGYDFEHEATYDRMCLVNDAVYIAKYASVEFSQKTYGYVPDDCAKHGNEWTATGAQFAVPYVFKTLFSHEPIEFKDMCETKSVSSTLHLHKLEDPPEKTTFIGKVGQFCPIKDGCDGRELLRESKDKEGHVKYAAVTGTKGYLWLESEMVKTLEKEGDIDRRYYDSMVDAAKNTVSEYGDFTWFVSDDPYIPTKIEERMPWDDLPE